MYKKVEQEDRRGKMKEDCSCPSLSCHPCHLHSSSLWLPWPLRSYLFLAPLLSCTLAAITGWGEGEAEGGQGMADRDGRGDGDEAGNKDGDGDEARDADRHRQRDETETDTETERETQTETRGEGSGREGRQ